MFLMHSIETRMFNHSTRVFNHSTHMFNHSTCMFHHLTRVLNHSTCVFKFVFDCHGFTSIRSSSNSSGMHCEYMLVMCSYKFVAFKTKIINCLENVKSHIIVVCSPKLFYSLEQTTANTYIQMVAGHIDAYTLKFYLEDHVEKFLPVVLNNTSKYCVPLTLTRKTIYFFHIKAV